MILSIKNYDNNQHCVKYKSIVLIGQRIGTTAKQKIYINLLVMYIVVNQILGNNENAGFLRK
jgi:hypothetical protein